MADLAAASHAWLDVLRERVAELGQKETARRLKVSAGSVSSLLAGKYKADTQNMKARVEGVFMAHRLDCPGLGFEVGADWCVDFQARPQMPMVAELARCWRECRAGCPHSRLKRGEAPADAE